MPRNECYAILSPRTTNQTSDLAIDVRHPSELNPNENTDRNSCNWFCCICRLQLFAETRDASQRRFTADDPTRHGRAGFSGLRHEWESSGSVRGREGPQI